MGIRLKRVHWLNSTFFQKLMSLVTDGRFAQIYCFRSAIGALLTKSKLSSDRITLQKSIATKSKVLQPHSLLDITTSIAYRN